jgi:SOS-response transcriptional repressor LexA
MITKQQRKALLFIEAEMERSGGIAPSVREIADHFHYRSPTMARRLLRPRRAWLHPPLTGEGSGD